MGRTNYLLKIMSQKSIGFVGSLLLVLVFLCSCNRLLTGTIDCKDISTYTSPYGVLNSVQATLGDVYFINQKDKYMGYVFNEKTDTMSVITDASVNNLVIAASIDLSASLDAQGSEMQLLATKIEESLERTTRMKLHNPVRQRLENPYFFLKQIEQKQMMIIDKLHTEDMIYMAITSVVHADSLTLHVENADTSNATIKTIKIENFTVKLTCNCNSLFDVDGRQASVFFKALFFKYDRSNRKLVPISTLIDFKGYAVNTINQ
jgi:hypothetical protein